MEKLEGEYRGLVVNNQDPDKDGRVKVFVEPLHRGVRTEDLPWAIPHPSVGMGGYEPDVDAGRSDFIPDENTWVVIDFESGRPEQPRYKFEAQNKDFLPQRAQGNEDDVYEDIQSNLGENEPDTEISEYPDSKTTKFKNGITLEIDNSEDNARMLIYHPSGYRHEVLSDGNVVTHAEGDLIEVIANKIVESESIHETITEKLIESDKFTVEASDIKLGDGTLTNLVKSVVQTAVNSHTHTVPSGSSAGPTTQPNESPLIGPDGITSETQAS
jgi:hypothetical protein